MSWDRVKVGDTDGDEITARAVPVSAFLLLRFCLRLVRFRRFALATPEPCDDSPMMRCALRNC